MRNLLVSTIAIVAISVVMIHPSHSQGKAKCFAHDQLTAGLDKEFDEMVKIRGLTNDGQKMMEIYVNKDTGKWTAVMVQTNGAACPVADGHSFDILDDVKPIADGRIL